MSYVLTNGHTYITKKPSGKFTVTFDVNIASQYETELKALNVIKCLPYTYKKQNYYPKLYEVQDTTKERQEAVVQVINPGQKQLTPVSYPVEDSEWMAEFKQNLKIVDKTLGSLKPMYAKLYEGLNKANDEIDDLEHAIELIRANAVRRCFLENELKKARKVRRECKDAMRLIEIVLKFNLDDWGTGKVPAEIVRLETRCYIPKVREDIFQ